MNSLDLIKSVLSAYIFDKSIFEKRTLAAKHFNTVSDFKAVYDALEKLHRNKTDFDDNLIVLEMERAGVSNAKAVLIDIISQMSITSVKAHEEEILETWRSNALRVETLKIFDINNLSAAQRSAKISKLQDQFRKSDSAEPIIKMFKISEIVREVPHFFLKDTFPIQKNEISLLTASGGGGKSFTALLLAAMLEAHEGLKVFAFMSEDKSGVTAGRLDSLKVIHPSIINADPVIAGKESEFSPFLMRAETGGFMASDYFYMFKNAVKEFDVIILDPLIAIILDEENNNAESRVLFSLLNRWIEEEDKTLIIIHHHNKKNESRGASGFVDAVRMHYVLSKVEVAENADDEEIEEANKERVAKIEKTNHYASDKREFTVRLFGDKKITKASIEGPDGKLEREIGLFPGAEEIEYEMPPVEFADVENVENITTDDILGKVEIIE